MVLAAQGRGNPEMAKPFFTVIVPVYNRAHLVQTALNSIENQTYKNFECRIVNDGSTDNSATVIYDWIKGKPKYSFLDLQKNVGVANARNAAIRNASFAPNSYLVFLDSDDEWDPCYLENRARLLEQEEIPVMHGGMRVVGGESFVPDKDDPSRKIAIADTSQGATLCIRPAIFEAVGGYRQMYGEDGDLLERIAAAGYPIRKVDFEDYVYHREHPDSITNTVTG